MKNPNRRTLDPELPGRFEPFEGHSLRKTVKATIIKRIGNASATLLPVGRVVYGCATADGYLTITKGRECHQIAPGYWKEEKEY